METFIAILAIVFGILGFLFGTGLKLITAGVMLFYLVVYAF